MLSETARSEAWAACRPDEAVLSVVVSDMDQASARQRLTRRPAETAGELVNAPA
jgi:hypothetical protein